MQTMKTINLMQDTYICEKILFLDGLTGQKKQCWLQYLTASNDLKKINSDTATYMIRMYADLAIYNSMIARVDKL